MNDPTRRPDLDPETRRRLAAVLARTTGASPDGEKLAALAAAERILDARGLRLPELIEAPPAADPPPLPDDAEARELLRLIEASGAELDEWSARFVADLRRWRGRLTDRQRGKLAEIAARCGVTP